MRQILILALIVLSLACRNEKRKEVEKPSDGSYYTCSMDPQVKQDKPGKCPICKMELTKVSGKRSSSGLVLSEEQMKLANIQTAILDSGFIGNEKVVSGKVISDENEESVVSTRFEGRIDKLHFKDPGKAIKAGETLYEIYSEDLVAAQKDLLLLSRKEKQLKSSGIIDYRRLIEAARNKLLLWGLSQGQINEMIRKENVQIPFPIINKENGIITGINVKEGDFVMAGTEVYRINSLSSVWVEAQLYAGELQETGVGKEVEIRIDAFPDKIFKGRISFVSPQLQTESKINLARIEIPNHDRLLNPGMQAYINIQGNKHRALLVDANAVLRDSKGASVWVKQKDGSFENRMVHPGIQSNDKIEILHGLRKGDEVVTSGAYLINSEYIFKKGANPMENMKM